MTTLSQAERKQLRAQAHGLKPVVLIGADGLTTGVTAEVDTALRAHGLIKIRVFGDDRAAREAILNTLCNELNAHPVQHIGKLLVLWRSTDAGAATEQATDADSDKRGKGPKTVKLIKTAKRGGQRPEVRHVKVLGNQHLTSTGRLRKKKNTKVSIKKRAQ